MTFQTFRDIVAFEMRDKQQNTQLKKSGKHYYFANGAAYSSVLAKQKEIELLKLENTNKSFTKMMAHQGDSTMLFVTYTMPPNFAVGKYLASADAIKSHLNWQAKSLAYHVRRILKSKKFKRSKKRRCALDDPIHYIWTLELQEKGDVHLHAAIFLKDDPELVKDFVRLLHEHRAKHDGVTTRYHNGASRNILPLGRCHVGLHPKFKSALEELSHLEAAEKKRKDKTSYEPKRYEYFMMDIAHFHYRYDRSRRGQGTAIEFYNKEKLQQSYDNLAEYISKITEAKYSEEVEQKALKTAVYTEMMEHHIKGTLEVDNKAKLRSDSEIFSSIGVKTIHYSQALFPTKLYQSLRTQLVKFSQDYRNLYKITIDQCIGKIRIEEVVIDGYAFKQVVHGEGGVIAGEQFKQGADYER
jgi:hypothetical protein